jgi:hypothetical protein
MRRGLLVAIVTLVLADLAMLGSVRNDRTSDDVRTITLDERELRLVMSPAEGAAVELTFEGLHHGVEARPDALRQPWITHDHLTQLGFDCSIWPADPRAPHHYASQLPRPAAVAYDLGTDAWSRGVDDWAARLRAHAAAEADDPSRPRRSAEALDADIEAVRRRASRLVPIDIGQDALALRGKYRNRPATIVLPVVVGVSYDAGVGLHARASVLGHLERVFPARIVVPAHLRGVFSGLPRPDTREVSQAGDALPYAPRYDVTIAIGPALRPWVIDARRLGAPDR